MFSSIQKLFGASPGAKKITSNPRNEPITIATPAAERVKPDVVDLEYSFGSDEIGAELKIMWSEYLCCQETFSERQQRFERIVHLLNITQILVLQKGLHVSIGEALDPLAMASNADHDGSDVVSDCSSHPSVAHPSASAFSLVPAQPSENTLGLPTDFVIGIVNIIFGLLDTETEVSLSSILTEDDASSGSATRIGVQSQLVCALQALAIISFWPHNAYLVWSRTPDFAGYIVPSIGSVVRKISDLVDSSSSLELIQRPSTKWDAVGLILSCLVYSAQYVSYCSIQINEIDSSRQYTVGSRLSNLPAQPWNDFVLQKLGFIQSSVNQHAHSVTKEVIYRRFENINSVPSGVACSSLAISGECSGGWATSLCQAGVIHQLMNAVGTLEALLGCLLKDFEKLLAQGDHDTVNDELFSVIGSVLIAQCELLFAAVACVEHDSLLGRSKSIALIEAIIVGFSDSSNSRHFVRFADLYWSIIPAKSYCIPDLLAKRGALALTINSRLAYSPSLGNNRGSQSFSAPLNVGIYVLWVSEFFGIMDRTIKWDQVLQRIPTPLSTKLGMGLASSKINEILGFCYSFNPDYRLSRCSSDFWPWHGTEVKSSPLPNAGSPGLKITIPDLKTPKSTVEGDYHTSVLQDVESQDILLEHPSDDRRPRRYQICTLIKTQPDQLDPSTGLPSVSVSDLSNTEQEDILDAVLNELIESSGAVDAFSQALRGICCWSSMAAAPTEAILTEEFSQLITCAMSFFECQLSKMTSNPKPVLPVFQNQLIAYLFGCLERNPSACISAARKTNIMELLLSEHFLAGGEIELSSLYDDKYFFDERQQQATPRGALGSADSKKSVMFWLLANTSEGSDKHDWITMCAFAWLRLRDKILIFFDQFVNQSARCGLFCSGINGEIAALSNSMKYYSLTPNTATMTMIYQCIRWIRHVLSSSWFLPIPIEDKSILGRQCICDIIEIASVQLEMVGLAKQTNIIMSELPKNKIKFLWPLRSTVVEMWLYLSTVDIFSSNIDWIVLFLELTKSASVSATSNSASKPALISHSSTTNIYGVIHDSNLPNKHSDDDATIASGSINSANAPPSLVSSFGYNPNNSSPRITLAPKARLKTLESLLLDPRCRAAALKILGCLISAYSCEMMMTMQSGDVRVISHKQGPASRKYERIALKSNYNFDVIDRMVNMVAFCIYYPQSADSYNCALLCLRVLTWLLRAKRNLMFRTALQNMFKSGDNMHSVLNAMVGLQRKNEVKNAVQQSPDSWILVSIVRQSLSLLTSIMAGHDDNRNVFSMLVVVGKEGTQRFGGNFGTSSGESIGPSSPSSTNVLPSGNAASGSSNGGSTFPSNTTGAQIMTPADSNKKKRAATTFSFDIITSLLMQVETSITLETIAVLFDMLLEVPCVKYRAEVTHSSHLLDTGFFDDDSDRPKIRSIPTLHFIFTLLPHCSVILQKFILVTFCNLLTGRASLANQAICVQSHPQVFDLVLDLFPLISDAGQRYLLRLLQNVGKHSISVAQLKHLFRMMQVDGGFRHPYTFRILQALQGMICEDSGPRHSFVFEGDNSGLRLPPIFSWPAKKGFSFCVWCRIESPKASDVSIKQTLTTGTAIPIGSYHPTIICFRSPSGAGVELILKQASKTGEFRIVLLSHSEAGQPSGCESTAVLTEGNWHFLAFSISPVGFSKKSEVALVVDGQQTTSLIEHPFMGDPILQPCIGTTPDCFQTTGINRTLRGQMGAIYVFRNPLALAKLKSIFDLGPTYMYCFESFTLEYKDVHIVGPKQTTTIASSAAASIFDGQLTSSIMLCYNPAVWNGNCFLDNTPVKNGIAWHVGTFAEVFLEQGVTYDDRGMYKMNAQSLQGTYRTITQDIRMALDSLGGIKTILPLFAQFDLPLRQNALATFIESETSFDSPENSPRLNFVASSPGGNTVDTEFSTLLFRVLRTLLASSSNRNRDLKSLGLLGYLLERVSPLHMTLEVVDIVISIFDSLNWNSSLQDSLLENFLTNFKYWRKCSYAVQGRMFEYLYSLVGRHGTRYCEVITVTKIIDAIQLFYSEAVGNMISNQSTLQKTGRSAGDLTALGTSGTGELSTGKADGDTPTQKLSSDGSRTYSAASQSSDHGSTNDPGTAFPWAILTLDQVVTIREVMLKIMFSLLCKVMPSIESDVTKVVTFIAESKSIVCQVEGLQILMKLLGMTGSGIPEHVVLGFLSKCNSTSSLAADANDIVLIILVQLLESSNVTVRLYSLLVLCRALVLGASSTRDNSLAVDVNLSASPTPHSRKQTPLPPNAMSNSASGDENFTTLDDFSYNSTFASPSSGRLSGSTRTADPTNLPQLNHSIQRKIVCCNFEEIGINVDFIGALVAGSINKLVSAVNSHEISLDTLARRDLELHVIVASLQMALVGNFESCDSLFAAIQYLSDEVRVSIASDSLAATDAPVNIVLTDIICTYNPPTDSESTPNLVVSISSNATFCMPMFFTALLSIAAEDFLNQDLRCKIVVNLKACLSTCDFNCNQIMRLPQWQSDVMKLLLSEKRRREQFPSPGTGVDDQSLALVCAKSAAVTDTCMRIFSEVHNKAIHIGCPTGPTLVCGRHSPQIAVTYSQVDCMKRVCKGDRQLGVSVLRETISVIHQFAEKCGYSDEIKVSVNLMLHVKTGLVRFQKTLEAAIELGANSSQETFVHILADRILSANVWLLGTVILEFLTRLPPVMLAAHPVAAGEDATINLGLRSNFAEELARTNELLQTVEIRKGLDELIHGFMALASKYVTHSRIPDWLNEEKSFKLDLTSIVNIGTNLTGSSELGNSDSHNSNSLMATLTLNRANAPHPSTLSKKKTPITHIAGGLWWLMMRILCCTISLPSISTEVESISRSISTDSQQELQQTRNGFSVNLDYVLDHFKKLIASCDGKEVEYQDFESLHASMHLLTRLGKASPPVVDESELPAWVPPSPTGIHVGDLGQYRTMLQLALELLLRSKEHILDVMDGELVALPQTVINPRRTIVTAATGGRPLGWRLRRQTLTAADAAVDRPVLGSDSDENLVAGENFPSAKKSIAVTLNKTVLNQSMQAFDVCIEQDEDFPAALQAAISEAIEFLNSGPATLTSDKEPLSYARLFLAVSELASDLGVDLLMARMGDLRLPKHGLEVQTLLDNSRRGSQMIGNQYLEAQVRVVRLLTDQQKERFEERIKLEETARRRMASKWASIVSDLANERGPWSSAFGSGGQLPEQQVFWMLDPHENTYRQRMRLKRNVHGTRHMVASKIARGSRLSDVTGDSTAEDGETGDEDVGTSDVALLDSNSWKSMMKYNIKSSDTAEDGSDNEEEDNPQNSKMLGRPWEALAAFDPDYVLFTTPVEIITFASNSTGGRTKGTLELTKSKLSFIRSGDNADEQVAAAAAAILNQEFAWVYQSYPSTTWATQDICAMYQRHYLLQFTALELFFTNRTSIFINMFHRPVSKQCYRLIKYQVKPPFLFTMPHRMPEKAVKTALSTNSTAMLTSAWVNRQVSNFQYLMSLNTVAGRSFNDCGQYPVFPWILADYNSEKLDLKNPKSFRDLRWPMGAQTEVQREFCLQRYHEANEMYECNPADEFPPFHHGTHYSCMGFIFWYLVRLEPFTSLHVWLQDGKFDHPDRLFTSVGNTFHGSTSNHNDVKELIPEFFYLPEFLENVNDLDLGTSQSGVKLGAVQLPPWCNGSAHEFIRLHRDALESEYVSANLHHWIDLIFGYKQRPPMFNGNQAAVDAINVYFHLTYSDAVNLEAVSKNDKALYDRMIRQVDNYGQTPNRLFPTPHPPRQPLNKVRGLIWPIASIVLGVDTLPKHEEHLKPELPKRIVCFKAEKVSMYPILMICEQRPIKKLVTVDSSRILALHSFVVKQPDVVPPYAIKIDALALRASMGQNSTGGWLSTLSAGMATNAREYYVGVPFSALGLASSRKQSVSNSTIKTSLIGTDENKRALIKKEIERSKIAPFPGIDDSRPAEKPLPGSNSAAAIKRPSGKSAVDTTYLNGPGPSSNARVGGIHRPRAETAAAVSPTSSVTAVAARNRSETASLNTNEPSVLSSGSGEIVSNTSTTRAQVRRTRVDEHLSPHLFAMVPDSRILFSCGHWDHSFKATQVDSGKLLQSVLVHSEVVTCLAVASDFGQHWLVTGSKDCTVMVWEVVVDRPAPVSVSPLHILFGHDDTITCIAVNAALDFVASGSDDGTVILSSLREGQYLRSIVLDVPQGINPSVSCSEGSTAIGAKVTTGGGLSGTSVHMLCISPESYLLIYTSDNTHHTLFSYTTNGRFLEKMGLQERLLCMILSEDGRVLVTGGERCLVVMRWVHNLQLACDGPRLGQEAVLDGKEGDQPPFLSPIRSLYLTQKERHLIVGLESGEMRILAQDSEYLRKRLVLNLEDIGLITTSSLAKEDSVDYF